MSSPASLSQASLSSAPSLGPEPLLVLLGNPNSGKTTFFNRMTGLRYKVGNYPGVTVERREGMVSLGGKHYRIADLPGVYSLDAHSLDESVTVEALRRDSGAQSPDVVVCIVDVTMLERGLYVVTEAIDRGLPVVVVLTMMDVLEKRGERVRVKLLERRLGVPIVAVHERRRVDELDSLASAITQVRSQPRSGGGPHSDSASTTPQQIASERYARITSIIDGCIARSEKGSSKGSEALDSVLTHPLWGTVVFVAIMALLFQLIFSVAALPMDWIEGAVEWCGGVAAEMLPPGLFRSLLVDGVLAGVGSVLVFMPQIGLLFFCLSLLEESGFLVRAALLMDSMLRRVGLQGRSFIPLLSSFACAIPGIMSTRVICSPVDRLLTILVAPLMSCSARLPVYTLLISAFFEERYVAGVLSLRGIILFSLYGAGIAGAALVSLVAKRFVTRAEPSVFVMEMPTLRVPSVREGAIYAVDRVLVFLRNTGPIILASSIVLWGLASFPGNGIEGSYAGMIGRFLEPIFAPLGFSWQVCVAIFCSFAAREVFVSSLGTILNVGSGEQETQTLVSLLSKGEVLSFPAGMAALVFFVFACQCMSTLAVVRRETGSWKWSALMFTYMMVLAWFGGYGAYSVAAWWGGR